MVTSLESSLLKMKELNPYLFRFYSDTQHQNGNFVRNLLHNCIYNIETNKQSDSNFQGVIKNQTDKFL